MSHTVTTRNSLKHKRLKYNSSFCFRSDNTISINRFAGSTLQYSMVQSNPPAGGRRRRVFTLPSDKEQFQNHHRTIQSQHLEKPARGLVEVSPYGMVSRRFTNEELTRLADKFVKLTVEVETAAVDKWRTHPQSAGPVYFAPHNNLPQARRSLSTFYRDHAMILLRERRPDGKSFLSNKQIQQASWNLLLTSTGLSLGSILDLVKTFLFHTCESGRLMDLLLDAPNLFKNREYILRHDGSGLFALVDLFQDSACNAILESSSGTFGSSSKRQFDQTLAGSNDTNARPSKRQRTATGAVGKENIYGGRSTPTCYVPLPLALRLLWVHLGDRDRAVNFSSPRAVSLEELSNQVNDMKKNSMVFDAYEDALRLYSLERLLLYPEQSPLNLKTIVETQILAHQ